MLSIISKVCFYFEKWQKIKVQTKECHQINYKIKDGKLSKSKETVAKNQIPRKEKGKRQREKRAKATRPPAPPQPPPLVPPPPPRPARALPAPVGLDPASAPRDSAGGARPRVGRQEEGSSSRAPCSAGARRRRPVLGRRSSSRGPRPRSGLGRRREAVAAPAGGLARLLLRDAAEDDEAVAAYALKWLGFALYHPVLISTISGRLAQSILATLVRLIMTTKMKAICNLAVWCISVQQLEASVVEDGLTPLLNAIVYALDNPFGSLSTAFEAIQGGKTNCS
ncbi:pre-mRNA-processing factor 40 homolog B [Triticum aestivum]|uniref:pre-mRNA-processing factor 40 homolog B n=1 Tax=Triticum aestivum TaxID=4565 RepID=UPI001D00DC84|nr:pre-mRNA-processing factor 40 homolog B-like [Triticum aestivum]